MLYEPNTAANLIPELANAMLPAVLTLTAVSLGTAVGLWLLTKVLEEFRQ